MGRRRNSRSKKAQRVLVAREAQSHLSAILLNPSDYPSEVVDSAAVHLVKTSQRHRLTLPSEARELVCRKCWSSHADGMGFRIRIKHGQRIKTCLKCGSVRRYGGGPKHHRLAGRSDQA
jgi:ribonuclease P protein subunit RPR2